MEGLEFHPTTMVVTLLSLFVIIAIGAIIFIISNQGKKKLIENHKEIVGEFYKSNKSVISALNTEILYLNEKKPEWNLHKIENKIRDSGYYKKTHSEIEEIVELSYMHDKKFDDMFDDVEVNIMKYEIIIDNFFKKYRKHHDMVNKSFIITRTLYNGKKDEFLERIYEVILNEKHNKDFIS